MSTALVDGNNSLGAVVGNFAMNLAITKAKETGVAWVTVRCVYCVRVKSNMLNSVS